MAGWLAPVLGAVGSIGSSLLGSAGAMNLSKKDKAFIEQENQKSRDFELDMWNKANEYNLPSAVMERLKSAGLNPNLVYQNGAESLASYAHAPGHSAPNMNSKDIALGLNNLGQSITGTILAMQQMKSNIALNDSQAYKNYQEGDKLKAEARSADVDAWLKEDNIDVLSQTIQNTCSYLEKQGQLTHWQAYQASIIYKELYRSYEAKANTYYNIGNINPRSGVVEYDENGEPIPMIGDFYAAMMYQYRHQLYQTEMGSTQVSEIINNIMADTELKFSQISLNGALQLYNLELAKTQQSQRALIASEIRKNDKLMDVLTSQIGLNDAQAQKLLNDISIGIENYNLDALKFNTTGRYSGNFSIFFNTLQDIFYQHQNNGGNPAYAPYHNPNK